MSSDEMRSRGTCTPEEIDEAAVWIARLRAPDRSLQMERGLRRWLAEKPSHGAAFEAISNAWELAGAMERRPFPRVSRWERAGFRAGFVRATAAVAFLGLIVIVSALLQVYGRGVTTNIGEQRTLTLDDGTRVFLNTASRLVVDYDDAERRVELKEGEALFEVAKRPDWPFVVTAGSRRITALGTSFVVRSDSSDLSVTLIEGKVAVAPGESLSHLFSSSRGEEVTLAPGQRLVLTAEQAAHIDRPSLDRLTAWRRGQIEFEETELKAAAAEMNRYSRTKLVIAPELAAVRINGVFRAGDAAALAAAIARAYDVRIERGADEIVLRSLPDTAAAAGSTAAP